MNKKRIIMQNIVLFLVSVLLYVFSFTIVINISNHETENLVISYTNQVSSELISEKNVDDVIINFSAIDNLRVSIYEENNNVPIADTRAFPSDKPGFDIIKNNVGNVYYSFSETLSINMIYFVNFDQDSGLYVRVGFPQSEGQKASQYIIYIGLVVFASMDIFYVLYSVYNFRKSILPLKKQVKRIQSIVGKDESKISNKDDLIMLSEAVDEVGSEFKKQLKETEQSKEKVDFVLNTINSGIVVIDSSEHIIMANDFACQILKINKDEVDNGYSNLNTLNNEYIEAVRNAIISGKNTRLDYLANDRVYSFEVSVVNYPWTIGENLSQNGAYILIYDITSQRNADAIQREFFANASHELKSPLTSIIGYQELIKEGMLSTDKELTNANERTLAEAKRMKQIVKYMLENSYNLVSNSVSEHDIFDYTTNIIEGFDFEIKEKNINVKTKLEHLIVKINHEDLNKLLTNLISNAIKYNVKDGSIFIEINVIEKYFKIIDTGIGINNSNIERIFDRFYMVDKGRSRENDSSGIGLSIVKNICDYYGFKILAESKVNKGSSFTIYFK